MAWRWIFFRFGLIVTENATPRTAAAMHDLPFRSGPNIPEVPGGAADDAAVDRRVGTAGGLGGGRPE